MFRKKVLKYWLLGLFCLLGQAVALGNNVPIIPVDAVFRDSILIQEDVLFFIDSTESLPIEKVVKKKFRKLNEIQPTGSLNPAYTYWVFFELGPSPNYDTLLLYAGEFDHLSLYDAENFSKKPIEGGFLSNFQQRAFKKDERYVPVELSKIALKGYYLKIENELRDFENKISLSLNTKEFVVDNRNRWVSQRSGYDVFSGFFFGTLIIFLVFSVFQYLYYRDKAYLFYVAYLGGVALYYLRIFESGTQFNVFFSFFMEWYYFFEAPIPLFSIAAYTYFLIYFLDLKSENENLYCLFKYSAIGILIYMVVDFPVKLVMGLPAGFDVYYYVRLSGILIGIYAVYEVLKLRNWLTFFIIVGSLFLLLGGGISIILYAIEGNSTKVFNDIVLNAKTGFWEIPISYMQMGIILEVLLFSMGLSYRNKINFQEKKEQERKWAQSELKALKAQLKPHFIYNSLNSVIDLIQQKREEKAEEYLVRFSHFLRRVLKNSEKLEIPIEEELEICEGYLEMEKLRFKDGFSYEIRNSNITQLDEVKIPPLLLQPFLENAIWHGLLHKETGERKVSLLLSRENGAIKCVIDDNGIGMEASRKINASRVARKQSHGISIISERLRIFSLISGRKLKYEVIDKTSMNGMSTGTRIEFSIPQN